MLLRLKLGGIKGQGFPPFGTLLLQNVSYSNFWRISCQSEMCSGTRVMQEGRGCKRLFYGFKGLLALGCPWQLLWLPFERIEQGIQMVSGLGHPLLVVIDHAQESL